MKAVRKWLRHSAITATMHIYAQVLDKPKVSMAAGLSASIMEKSSEMTSAVRTDAIRAPQGAFLLISKKGLKNRLKPFLRPFGCVCAIYVYHRMLKDGFKLSTSHATCAYENIEHKSQCISEGGGVWGSRRFLPHVERPKGTDSRRSGCTRMKMTSPKTGHFHSGADKRT